MRPSRVLLLHLPLACAIVWPSTQAALADNTTAHSRFAGVYLSHYVGPSMNLSLGRDGTATVTEDPGNGATTLFGHWVDSGSQVTVTFDAVEGKPVEPPMVFAARPRWAAGGYLEPCLMGQGGSATDEKGIQGETTLLADHRAIDFPRRGDSGRAPLIDLREFSRGERTGRTGWRARRPQ